MNAKEDRKLSALSSHLIDFWDIAALWFEHCVITIIIIFALLLHPDFGLALAGQELWRSFNASANSYLIFWIVM